MVKAEDEAWLTFLREWSASISCTDLMENRVPQAYRSHWQIGYSQSSSGPFQSIEHLGDSGSIDSKKSDQLCPTLDSP